MDEQPHKLSRELSLNLGHNMAVIQYARLVFIENGKDFSSATTQAIANVR